MALPPALRAALEAQRDGGDPIVTAKKVLDAEPRLGVDYVALADFDGPTLVGAVRVGSTRLIDNVVTEEP
jgi:pantothenate synthetase